MHVHNVHHYTAPAGVEVAEPGQSAGGEPPLSVNPERRVHRRHLRALKQDLPVGRAALLHHRDRGHNVRDLRRTVHCPLRYCQVRRR